MEIQMFLRRGSPDVTLAIASSLGRCPLVPVLAVLLLLSPAAVAQEGLPRNEACIKYYKCVPLANFNCYQVTGEVHVHQVCYARQKRYMIVWLGRLNTPYHFCDIGSDIVIQFLKARSKEDYYDKKIRSSATEGRYDCRNHPIPKV
jgi:KTSC domain